MNSGQICAKGRQTRPESGPCFIRKPRPCLGPALAPDAAEPILRHVRLGFGNVHHLIAEVFSFLGIPRSGQGFVTMLAHGRKNLLNQIHLAAGMRSRLFPLCPGCPPRLRLFDFFGGRALDLATDPSEEGGFEELEESRSRSTCLGIIEHRSTEESCNMLIKGTKTKGPRAW